MKHLVVNADDFGFTRDVSDGIVEAHRNGILTATTLMANGAAFEHAVELASRNPTLDVGCHLMLVQGQSVLEPDRPLPATVKGLLRALLLGQMAVYEELRAQVRKILAAGITPTHLDTHKHTHMAPSVLKATARISREFGIRWVRRPFDIPMGYGAPLSTRVAGRVMAWCGRRFGPVLERNGCRSTDHFAGFQITGRFHSGDLARLFEHLPEGTTELMCHPGFCTGELRSAPTRLKESRRMELDALTAPETRRALERSGIRLVSYRDLT